jgi:EAL domain-containing protein (putative c-di-GMP-specific phosphodiesterase class I)/PAS domain-containing protein
VKPHRPLRALLVDVPPGQGRAIVRALEEAGWRVEAEHADGAQALAEALQSRGWQAVLYGGDGPDAVPARKALALVRLADPYLPFLAVSPDARAGDISAVVRGLDGAAAVVADPGHLPRALARALDTTRLRRRVGGAHRLLLAQQAVTDHVAAGLEAGELCARVLATLGETLGWSCGAVWRPAAGGASLRCAGTWHVGGRPDVAALAEATRDTAFAPGQGLPGRVWAFRRPAWVADVGTDGNEPRAALAVRAGLMTAVAFPIALADRCAGVIEFFSRGTQQPNAEISAMFATVGAQLAQYLERAGVSGDDRLRRWLDAAGAIAVGLDAGEQVVLASRAACAVLARPESELLGSSWDEAVRTAPASLTWKRTALPGGEVLVVGAAVPPVRSAQPVSSRESAALGQALRDGELDLRFQPVVALDSGAIVAVEARPRWELPERGMLPPAALWAAAERAGLLDDVTDWLLDSLAARREEWTGRGLHPELSFAVPAGVLERIGIAARLREREGGGWQRLTVELAGDPLGTTGAIAELRELGVGVALRGLGMAATPLSRLRGLPVTALKLDGALLRGVPEDPEAAAVVASLLALARALGRTAVADGVETVGQRAFLLEHECPRAQGPLIGPPAPAAAIEPLLAAAAVRAAA